MLAQPFTCGEDDMTMVLPFKTLAPSNTKLRTP